MVLHAIQRTSHNLIDRIFSRKVSRVRPQCPFDRSMFGYAASIAIKRYSRSRVILSFNYSSPHSFTSFWRVLFQNVFHLTAHGPVYFPLHSIALCVYIREYRLPSEWWFVFHVGSQRYCFKSVLWPSKWFETAALVGNRLFFMHGNYTFTSTNNSSYRTLTLPVIRN